MTRLLAFCAGAVCAVTGAFTALSAGAEDKSYGIDSVAFGVLAHDVGVFGRSAEPGTDFNFEVRFDKLAGSFWDALLNPQPNLGLTVNDSGTTSQAYFGLTWLFDLGSGLFGGGSLGGSVHNGETETSNRKEKSLGSTALFRESVEFGYRFAERHSLSLMLDHISNAGLAEHNEGLDNLGLRYALRF